MATPTHIDLFAGCGGLSLGLLKAGWKGVFAVEKNEMAFETLKHNLIDKQEHFDWPEWLPRQAHDIKLVLSKYRAQLTELQGNVTLVAGGPPCQGFSTAGRRNAKDKRNQLVDSYVEFISIVQPKMVFFENVRGFTIDFSEEDKLVRAYSNRVVSKLEKLGYSVAWEMVDFSEFGVPQRRKRFILVGSKTADPSAFFKLVREKSGSFLEEKGLPLSPKVADALSDLESNGNARCSSDPAGFKIGAYSRARTSYQKVMKDGVRKRYADSHRFANHKESTREVFRIILDKLPRNVNVAKKASQITGGKKMCIVSLDPREQSPTLTTLPDDYIHYAEPRILTVREYARLQTFPDSFEFKGKYTTGGKRRVEEVPRYTQVGNAVPPLFAEQAGIVLKRAESW